MWYRRAQTDPGPTVASEPTAEETPEPYAMTPSRDDVASHLAPYEVQYHEQFGEDMTAGNFMRPFRLRDGTMSPGRINLKHRPYLSPVSIPARFPEGHPLTPEDHTDPADGHTCAFVDGKPVPAHDQTEAHEITHVLFAMDPVAGRKAAAKLRELHNYPEDGTWFGSSFEGIMDLGAFYAHDPEGLREKAPHYYAIARNWLGDRAFPSIRAAREHAQPAPPESDEASAPAPRRAEADDYPDTILRPLPKREPGLHSFPMEHQIGSISVPGHHVAYHGPDGMAAAAAHLVEDGQGLAVKDFAADKRRGLLGGRAAVSVGREIQRLKAGRPAGTMSPDAERFLQHSLQPTATHLGWVRFAEALNEDGPDQPWHQAPNTPGQLRMEFPEMPNYADPNDVVPQDHRYDPHGDDVDGLYHVTTNRDRVMNEGLRSRSTLDGIQGLGGGAKDEAPDKVSATWNSGKAQQIEDSIGVASAAARDQLTASAIMSHVEQLHGGNWDILPDDVVHVLRNFGVPRHMLGYESDGLEEWLDENIHGGENKYHLLQQLDDAYAAASEDDTENPSNRVGFTAPYASVKNIDPAQIATLRLRALQSAKPEVVPDEQELRYYPAHLEIDSDDPHGL